MGIRLRAIAGGLLMAALLTGCGTERAVRMPDEMPEDFQFSVRYGITSRNEIDTFDGTVTKDLIANGTATAELRFTDAEMADIYEEMRKINVMKELDLVAEDSGCGMIPYEEDFWTIRLNGRTIELHWSAQSCTLTKDAERLKALRTYIVDFVKEKEAYRRLPEPEGGYE